MNNLKQKINNNETPELIKGFFISSWMKSCMTIFIIILCMILCERSYAFSLINTTPSNPEKISAKIIYHAEYVIDYNVDNCDPWYVEYIMPGKYPKYQKDKIFSIKCRNPEIKLNERMLKLLNENDYNIKDDLFDDFFRMHYVLPHFTDNNYHVRRLIENNRNGKLTFITWCIILSIKF